MAVSGSAERDRQTWGGERKQEGDTRSVVYLVHTTDVDDGPGVVLTAPGLPFIGSYYTLDVTAGGVLQCVSLRPERDGANAKLWRVTAEYQLPQLQLPVKDDGETSDDPTEWHAEISISTTTVSRPFTHGVFWGFEYPNHLTGETKERQGSTFDNKAMPGLEQEGAVTNAAGEPYDPPHEEDWSRFTITIATNMLEFPSDLARQYKDAVNSDTYKIGYRNLGFVFPVRPGESKMRSIGGQLMYYKGFPYWKVNITLEIDTHFGWFINVLNAGLNRRIKTGESDGKGGTFDEDNIKNGQVPWKAIEVDGEQVTNPVPLNENGQPMDNTQSYPYNILYTRWRPRVWLPFAKLKLGDSMPKKRRS